MLGSPEEAEVLGRLVSWGEAEPSIRALILTSSRARADASVDALSDYDLIVAVRDPVDFASSRGWASSYGRPLVGWGDESELHGVTTHFRSVVYEDGVRVDYTVWPDALLERVAEAGALPECLDVGYRVLVDKDHRTASWKPPAQKAHIPAPPTRAEYEALLEEFWWDAIIAAKGLWRGDVVFAKFVLDYEAKFVALRRILEWRIELDHDWSLRPGAYGRGLERLLPADIWSELAHTYVGTELEANWDALFRTAALLRRVATEVGDALGYAYPKDVDEAVSARLREVRRSSRVG